jgi:hypothetical protein
MKTILIKSDLRKTKNENCTRKKPANSLAQSVDLLRFEFENILFLFSLRSKQELQTNTPKRKLFAPGLI